MRSPSRPRITGRLALGPKYVDDTPGSLSSVSPSVLAWRTASASPPSVETGATMSFSSLPSGLAVTTTSRSVPVAVAVAVAAAVSAVAAGVAVCACAGAARAASDAVREAAMAASGVRRGALFFGQFCLDMARVTKQWQSAPGWARPHGAAWRAPSRMGRPHQAGGRRSAQENSKAGHAAMTASRIRRGRWPAPVARANGRGGWRAGRASARRGWPA
ncbi:hypothetical protein D9M70_394780 [compost metagenome]